MIAHYQGGHLDGTSQPLDIVTPRRIVPHVLPFPIWRYGTLYVGEGWYPDPYGQWVYTTVEWDENSVTYRHEGR